MTPQERFDELVSGYLDGSLDEDGTGELNSLLAAKPEYATRFTSLSRLHGFLVELEGPPSPAPDRLKAYLLIAALVAAGVLALIYFLYTLVPR